MEIDNCLCDDTVYQNGHALPDQSYKPKSPSIERCMSSEFRERSNTSPTELRDKMRSRPRMRLARDAEQPSSGSLTRQTRSYINTRSEEEDSVMPMMRPRSNTCPEKRALQRVRRRIRNRPPTPPPGDIPSPGSLQSSPRERAPSLSHSRECLLDTMVAEVPERDFQSYTSPSKLMPPIFKPGSLDSEHITTELHRVKLTENNNVADPCKNSVSIGATGTDNADPQHRFRESGEILSCRRNAKEVNKLIAPNARLSLP